MGQRNVHTLLLGMLACVAMSSVKADDWGCQVLLCLSNPQGPTDVAECRPPIHRLWHELSRGHAFPSCATANAHGSYARAGWDYYDPCPPGTQALAAGQYAVKAQRTWRVGMSSTPTNPVFAGIGLGAGPGSGPKGPKVCVAGQLGQTTVGAPVDGFSRPPTAGVYQTVVTMPPYPSGNVVDVYVDNRFVQRVHW